MSQHLPEIEKKNSHPIIQLSNNIIPKKKCLATNAQPLKKPAVALKLDTRAIQFLAYFVDVMHFECHMTKTITPGEETVDLPTFLRVQKAFHPNTGNMADCQHGT